MCDTATVSQSAEHQTFNWRKCLIYVSNRSINTKRELNSVQLCCCIISKFIDTEAISVVTCPARRPHRSPRRARIVSTQGTAAVYDETCHCQFTVATRSSRGRTPHRDFNIRRRTQQRCWYDAGRRLMRRGCGTGRRFVVLNIDGRASI